jgi:hypothetical protein
VELRASPPKRSKQVMVHGAVPSSARALNFAREQCSRVLAGSRSGGASRVSEGASEGEVEVQGEGVQIDVEDQFAADRKAVTTNLARGEEEGEAEAQGVGAHADVEDRFAASREAVTTDLAKWVEDLNVKGVKRKESVIDSWRDMQERVSFGTPYQVTRSLRRRWRREVS